MLLAWLAAPLGAWAAADVDPPGRVGRLAAIQGDVAWFDVEQGGWAEALRNRPITSGDRLSTGRDAAAEVRIGSTRIRLDEATEIEMTRLDDERIAVKLHRGRVALALRTREVAAETRFGTDEAWLQPLRAGLYRLDRVDDTTEAAVWRGELAVEGIAATVAAGSRMQLWREGSPSALLIKDLPPLDDRFAALVLREDRDEERTASASHVSPEMTGIEDLDRYGRWESHPDYGPVWAPLSVDPGWAPYRQGRWQWVRPWGWTWVDAAPWGFAPFHYGRWAHWHGRWVWVPGRWTARPVFAPALVAWIDGPSIGITIGSPGPTLSWVPLAPWEVFRPSYRHGPGYHDRVNPPDPRWRHPPRGEPGPGVQPGHRGVPGAVTVAPSDPFRRPPPPRDRIDDPRPQPRPRPPADERPRHPPEPPPPMVKSTPLPSRPQPVPNPGGHLRAPVPPLNVPTVTAPTIAPTAPKVAAPVAPPPPRMAPPLESKPQPPKEREKEAPKDDARSRASEGRGTPR